MKINDLTELLSGKAGRNSLLLKKLLCRLCLARFRQTEYYLAAIAPRLYSTNLNKAIINKANLEDLERRAPGRRNSVPGDLG
jgi:hypothetical protein